MSPVRAAEAADAAKAAGVDVGTSSVKVVVVDRAGDVVARAERPLPPPDGSGGAAVQDPGAVASAAEAALDAAADTRRDGGPWRLVALTGQRDTFLLAGPDGVPATPLVSWRDARDAEGPLVECLLAEISSASVDRPPDAGTAHHAGALLARTLTSWLAERWTGRAAETPGTRSRHLAGASRRRVRERLGAGALPEVVAVGAAVGAWRGVPLHLTAGDKNCELLANGVVGPGRAGLSLGSAVSLGVLVPPAPESREGPGADPSSAAAAGSSGSAWREPPFEPPAGVVLTPAALPGRWNAETGLVVGMDGRDRLEALAGSGGEEPLAPRFREVPVLRPWFSPALDGAGSGVVVRALEREPTPVGLRQAWAQGVAAEVARLRPALQAAGGARIEEVVLSGGGGAEEGWDGLVAAALAVPVRRAVDRWRGARGAVACALRTIDPGWAERVLTRLEAELGPHRAASDEERRAAERWMDAYEELVEQA